jgi:GTP:adenosylcobinamide-phosphate guanylyltransferase
MKKFNVIILAGGEKGPLYETTGFAEKALIPIHGTPMVSRVIESFAASERVDKIVVVGSSHLDALDAMRHVRKRIFTAANLVQNLLLAISYVKHRLYHSASEHDGYIISFCDAVFLTPQVIDDTLAAIEQSDGEIVLHYVEKESFVAANLPTQRTYIPVAGKQYTGTTIYYVKKFGKVLAAMPQLSKLRKHRKDPQAMLRLIGCEDADLADIEEAISQQLAAKVRIRISPHATLGLDVDKPADLELAQKWLKK